MIIYRDSYTSGENNGFVSFANYLNQKKRAISGSCIGDYSIYPVRCSSFLEKYKKTQDTVLLEYGINDSASLVARYVSKDVVNVSLAKARDLLKYNEVYFLALTRNENDLLSFCKRYTKYLNFEYLKGLYFISEKDYYESYKYFVNQAKKYSKSYIC